MSGQVVGVCESLESPLSLPSILGMHIFGCKFSLRTDTGDTIPDRKNFDSLLWAIVTVFQVSVHPYVTGTPRIGFFVGAPSLRDPTEHV